MKRMDIINKKVSIEGDFVIKAMRDIFIEDKKMKGFFKKELY